MKAVVQRVAKAQVEVKGKTISSIYAGLVILLGVSSQDSDADVAYLVNKICKLRIISDSQGKMNLSIKDTGGSILVVSQFTLLANLRKGNRPSFIKAALPQKAKRLYRLFVNRLQQSGLKVRTGRFAAYMKVSLVNDGPVTILLDSQAKT